jgi:signal transduction histidine kinase
MAAVNAAIALQNARLFAAVARAKREWEATFDALVDGLLICDAAGRIVRTNRALAARLRTTPWDLVGRLRLHPHPTEVGRLIGDVVKAAQRDARLAVCQLVLDLPATPLTAVVDVRGIEEVLRNLLDNACRYSPDGGTITVRGRREGDQLIVAVQDEGIGIPADDRERVFDRFYRVEDEQVRAMGGIGLGLAVCKGIVEAHGGRIWVESAPGRGSVFIFTLPARM